MAEMGFWYFAQKDPTLLGLVDPDGKEWTRGQLLAEANQLVHGLRALGLETGDAVAVIMPNCKEYLSLSLAVAQAGFYLVPINWHLAASEIAYILKDSAAKAFISHERISAAAKAAAKEAEFTENAAFSVGHIEGFRPFQALIDGQSIELPDKRTAGAVMNYTSGTTGQPKGVKRPLTGLDPETAASFYTMALGMFGIQPEDNNVHFCGSPLYHTAVMVWATNSLHMGHPVILVDKWDAELMLQLIDKYKITHSHMVPTQFVRLLKLPEEVRNKYDCSSTRYMIHAAAPCPPHIKQQMLDWWGDCIFEYYAATEGGGTMVTPLEWRKYPGTVGKAWPTADIKIFDDDANELPADEQGTVYMLLGDASKFEYKGDKNKTEKERIGNYFTVGDIGYLNEEGYLFLCDRKIDMIISGGANIYPREIENVLMQHPKIADCAVFGIPHDEWGEEIKAAVQLIPEAASAQDSESLAAEIIQFCSQHLAKMKLPKSIDFMDELPRDPNGKLYKRRLREPYWKDHDRQV
jgi:long-chain acyl-CoA synthetase